MNDPQNRIFIPGNVPSLKGDYLIVGKRLIQGKRTKTYINTTGYEWLRNTLKFKLWLGHKEPPYQIHFKFFRKSRHAFDYINAQQIVQDLMVTFNWLEDDNCNILLPVFEPYEYSKDRPGVEIWMEE